MSCHRVADLTGALLDAAVAKAEGIWRYGFRSNAEVTQTVWLREELNGYYMMPFSPSTNWADGGPIIERETISMETNPSSMAPLWVADRCADNYDPGWTDAECPWRGPTPLVAAMRAYVASKLGAEIELP